MYAVTELLFDWLFGHLIVFCHLCNKTKSICRRPSHFLVTKVDVRVHYNLLVLITPILAFSHHRKFSVMIIVVVFMFLDLFIAFVNICCFYRSCIVVVFMHFFINTRENVLYVCIHDFCLLFMLSGSFKEAYREERKRRELNILAFCMYVALLAQRPG